MTSSQIRQSFLDFFKSKQHTIVPSASLMPDSPNLLFTNAGMNQFVPIFLGQTQCPYTPGRAADTQKCIRAGGKHNDLEDVGLDTYHHTFFEMLGNWSFGDYFKQEAIAWAWELVVEKWKFSALRLYATVYKPGPGEPSEFDQEAYGIWARLFQAAGLDPKVHVLSGGKKDNFWMMGDTGPCGPCSELHVDLTPEGNTQGQLINLGDARCIEIWNLVFIQFNANPDGSFTPLPAKHVDTGMGFERVTGILQNTKGLTDFSRVASNYETDIFRPIFDALEKLSGKKYGSTLPTAMGSTGDSPVPLGDPPSETRVTSESQENPGSQPAAPSHSAGLVAQQHGPVARATQKQIALDIAFRVIADHIRTLSFAIADGIQPSNEGRGYVLRRILRRAVRYGRTLGFHEPFFYKLVDVLADTMGDVFPEIQSRKKHVQEVIRTEEEAFNKTLDKGIALFSEEVARITNALGSKSALGSARVPRAVSGVAPGTRSTNIPVSIESAPGSKYSKRNLPHFERPWAKYMVTFTTINHRQLSSRARDIVLESLLFTHRQRRWQLFAACVMPDHVHALFEPQIKEQDPDGNPIFWPLIELLHSVKSFTVHEINKTEGTSGSVWEKESFDRLMRSDADLEEKFHYICRNPWDNGVVPMTEPYRWLWTAGEETGAHASGVAPEISFSQSSSSEKLVERSARRDASQNTRDACAPQISGAFAFRLYDEQGFPLDLTELMARERGLTVDVGGFNRLMEEQRARARAAQKKEIISLSQIETTTPTKFVGYDKLETPAKVLEVVQLKDKTAIILDTSACYAEMGGQVGDTGELEHGARLWRITNTQKSGNTWLHLIEAGVEQATSLSRPATGRTERKGASVPDSDALAQSGVTPLPVGGSPTDTGESPVLPIIGSEVRLAVDAPRRSAIQRHHTVTHLLHWALHEVVSRDASQKGSFVGPDKLTFDFNSAPLTAQQVADIEKLVNERILENAPVTWLELPYAQVKQNAAITQFFGEKYGETVRVLQIGGDRGKLNGYSMELCGGTHVRATGEIGLFRIVGENAIAAGVRRIEAVAGLEAYQRATDELQLIKTLAGKVNSPVGELERKIESLLAQQKELEKQLRAQAQRQAAETAKGLVARAQVSGGIPAIIENMGAADGDTLQSMVNELKGQFKGVIVLGGVANGAVALVAAVSPEFTAKVQAGKIIQQIAPVVGGKGGGKPDNARGGGKDVAKLDEALANAKRLLGP